MEYQNILRVIVVCRDTRQRPGQPHYRRGGIGGGSLLSDMGASNSAFDALPPHTPHKLAPSWSGTGDQRSAVEQSLNFVSSNPAVRVAICGHGRVGTLWATGEKLLENLVRPLQADLFVLAIAGDSPCPHPHCRSNVWGSTRDAAAQTVHRYLSTVPQTHLVVEEPTFTELAAASPYDRRILQHQYGGFWERTYLDLTNQLKCFEQIERHEAGTGDGSSYDLIGHIRLDVMILDRLPVRILSELQTVTRSQRTAWVPLGDDHGGIIDLMAFASRPAAQVIRGARGNASRWVHKHILQQAFRHSADDGTNSAYFFPERITWTQLYKYNTEARRFEWRHCRVSDAGTCRYPGEMQRLLRGSIGAPIAYSKMLCTTCEHRHLICGGVLSELAARDKQEKSVAQAPTTCCKARSGKAPSWAGAVQLQQTLQCTLPNLGAWKGGQACNLWHDHQCCALSAACASVLPHT